MINVKSDHGTESINKNLIKFMESKGINFIHFTPQQNGRDEHLHQTLNNRVITLWNSVEFPLKFWDSAIFMRYLFVQY